MSFALSDIQLRFKKFGKFAYIANLVNSQIVATKTAHAATVDQSSQTDPTAEFDINDGIITALGTTVKSFVTSGGTVPVASLTAATAFLKTFVGVRDLGLSTSAANAAIGTALAAAMTTAGATVAASGTNGSNSTGFAMYFANNFGIVLPQSGSPNIPDSYITATVL